ncbi:MULTISPECIES: sugar porter family MFS transporter [Niastella]|uniref:Sugar porter family MFS transporter n=1 Tax=Niastella soli TaxID=2821487 RepID=A0ABS3Z5G5_9BACT|nr:sugar porter family MFS transporter [Niastella soli]MBO9204910.1 sugar porter family MFS transporter [Niastella soli]
MLTNNKAVYLFLITGVVSLGGFLFGFDMAVVSGVLPLLKTQFSLSPAMEGWFVSAALVGCIIGVAISGELSDRLGRKNPLMLAALLFLLSALGCSLLPSLSGIIVARMMGGVGIGLASNVVPLYISEIAPSRIRGRLVTYYQFALTLGILAAYLTNSALLNYGIAHGNEATDWLHRLLVSEVWRGMFAVGVVPAVLFFIGLWMVPESPRWLIQQQRIQEATIILQRIHSVIDAQASLQQGQQLQLQDKRITYRTLLEPHWRKALIIGMLLPLFSQFSGINAIIYYGPSILNKAGVSLSNSLLSQIIFGGANMLFTLLAIWKVDSLGRRPLYLAGTAGATISLILTGICFFTGVTTGWLLLVCVLAFLASFAFSIGPLKFVVASEIFPGIIRGRAMAISIMVMWVADTIVGQLTPMLLKSVGAAFTFWLFAGFCLIAFFTVYKLLPETKGRSLEQIEKDWKDQPQEDLFVTHVGH